MSLFLRIFLAFWLAALLLAVSFFLIGRYYGSEAIDKSRAVVEAQAEVVAALWLEGDRRATARWLRHQGESSRLLLLDGEGQSPFPRMRRHATPWPHGAVSAGVLHLGRGRLAIVVALPGVAPPLYLVKPIHVSPLQQLPGYLWLLLMVAIIGLVSFLIASTLSRRLRRLRGAVQVVAAGDTSARVEVDGRDEVAALAGDFNLMAERVSEMLASQRQLVSDVSHELRSPLARLRIALELAERADEPAVALARIEKEADELERLIADLLSLARIESGQSQLERQPVALCELLQQVVADANFEGERENRRVVMAACEASTVEGDPVLLHAAIENVVRNALRYTPGGGVVTVTPRSRDGRLVIEVDDQGPGVPGEALGRLFEPFTRVGEARDRLSGGYGLGLAITGRTLEAHGGRAVAENLPGGGLRVTLTLPCQDN